MRDKIGENGTCIEGACNFTFEGGHTFEAGGAWIGIDKNGKHSGVVYGEWSDNPRTVSNWHGDIKATASFGRVFRGNMGDRRRHVWFLWKGIRYHGLWAGIDYNQAIRVREVKC